MKILSINSGSSSLKFSLFDMSKEEVIASGLFERIGLEASSYTIKYNGEKIKEEVMIGDHNAAVNILFDKLITLNIIDSLEDIDGVGHRVLHGKDFYDKSVVVNDEVLNNLNKIIDLGPLHMHANISGIEAFREALPNTPMVAVFDTAFHQSMEDVSYIYHLVRVNIT